ncbi:MAG: FUSC family protein [Acidimicrobiales bacterium]
MRFVRVPSRTSAEFAVKAGIATIIAIGTARVIGLNSPYWAGISAVVATAGTLGASINAAVMRIVATVIALLIAIGVVLLPVDGLAVAGITVSVTLLIMSSLNLEAGAKLAGASTLLLTAIPQGDPLSTAIGRGLNVPLGCIVAVAVGLVIFPRRAVTGLRIGMTEDFVGSFRLTAEALEHWLDSTTSPQLTHRLNALLDDVAKRETAYAEASYEPSGIGDRSADLLQALFLTARLSRICRSVLIVTEKFSEDSIQRLLESEFRTVIEALHTAISDIDEQIWLNTAKFSLEVAAVLKPATTRLDQGFRRLRSGRETAPFSDSEVEHLLHVMWCIHRLSEALHEASDGNGPIGSNSGRPL